MATPLVAAAAVTTSPESTRIIALSCIGARHWHRQACPTCLTASAPCARFPPLVTNIAAIPAVCSGRHSAVPGFCGTQDAAACAAGLLRHRRGRPGGACRCAHPCSTAVPCSSHQPCHCGPTPGGDCWLGTDGASHLSATHVGARRGGCAPLTAFACSCRCPPGHGRCTIAMEPCQRAVVYFAAVARTTAAGPAAAAPVATAATQATAALDKPLWHRAGWQRGNEHCSRQRVGTPRQRAWQSTLRTATAALAHSA